MAYAIRAVQLDLARQTETVGFVKDYIDGIVKAGFNTLVLYLEGRIRTKTFALPEAESYSADQMREIVSYATSKGIDIVPVVSVLGHAEHFFRHPGLEDICEEEHGPTRFDYKLKQTFCHSRPQTRKFLESYLSEIIEIFPGKNFHAGLDESFNAGFCDLCSKKTAKRQLGAFFSDVVLWMHDFLASKGRRMWMWDDFFEFFPEELKKQPKDIMLCHWQYDGDISRHGARAHYYNRYRADWLQMYSALGFEAMACGGASPSNSYTLNNYARKHNVAGVLMTQWEMSTVFFGFNYIGMYAMGKLFNDPDGANGRDLFKEAVDDLFPSLTDVERAALLSLTYGPHDSPAASLDAGVNNLNPSSANYPVSFALAVLKNSKLHPGTGTVPERELSEAGLLDDIVTQSGFFALGHDFRVAAPLLALPNRTEKDIAIAKNLVAKHRAEAEELLVRRTAQEKAWRPACCPNEVTGFPKAIVSWCDKVAAMPDTAAKNEALVEIQLSLPDFHGTPIWTIELKTTSGWKTIASRKVWKPESRDWANFEHNVRFTLDETPLAMRITHCGYGTAGLNFVAVETADKRWVPSGITNVSGLVRDVQNILIDTYDPAIFGYADRCEQILEPRLAETVSVLEVSLAEEKPGAAHKNR